MADEITTETQKTEENVPPQVAGEVPPQNDPTVIGTLTVDEIGMLNGLRQQGNTVTLQIGLAEIRKSRLLFQLQEVEDRAQMIQAQIGKRLGIPEGAAWQLSPDGKARMVQRMPQGFPPVRPVQEALKPVLQEAPKPPEEGQKG